MQTVCIPEYAREKIPHFDSNVDIEYLKKSCFGTDTKNPPFEVLELKDGKVEIRNTSYAGVIQLGEFRIEFSTKVKTNLFYMLSFLKDEGCFRYDPDKVIDLKEGQSFFDILGKMFLNELEKISRVGFYKKYVKKE
jgi:5-methylcytosine-specific restriction endonuclease McrBC regulatory subunit McrC